MSHTFFVMNKATNEIVQEFVSESREDAVNYMDNNPTYNITDTSMEDCTDWEERFLLLMHVEPGTF